MRAALHVGQGSDYFDVIETIPSKGLKLNLELEQESTEETPERKEIRLTPRSVYELLCSHDNLSRVEYRLDSDKHLTKAREAMTPRGMLHFFPDDVITEYLKHITSDEDEQISWLDGLLEQEVGASTDIRLVYEDCAKKIEDIWRKIGGHIHDRVLNSCKIYAYCRRTKGSCAPDEIDQSKVNAKATDDITEYFLAEIRDLLSKELCDIITDNDIEAKFFSGCDIEKRDTKCHDTAGIDDTGVDNIWLFVAALVLASLYYLPFIDERTPESRELACARDSYRDALKEVLSKAFPPEPSTAAAGGGGDLEDAIASRYPSLSRDTIRGILDEALKRTLLDFGIDADTFKSQYLNNITTLLNTSYDRSDQLTLDDDGINPTVSPPTKTI